MKFLLVLLVIVVAVGIWRNKRRPPPAQPASTSAKRKLLTPQDMVECAHCGLHLPRSEALSEHGTFFCSAEHQTEAGRAR